MKVSSVVITVMQETPFKLEKLLSLAMKDFVSISMKVNCWF